MTLTLWQNASPFSPDQQAMYISHPNLKDINVDSTRFWLYDIWPSLNALKYQRFSQRIKRVLVSSVKEKTMNKHVYFHLFFSYNITMILTFNFAWIHFTTYYKFYCLLIQYPWFNKVGHMHFFYTVNADFRGGYKNYL